MTYVFVGLGFMAFLSASMLAIDVGMLMTARNQAQNSADAGALAGAVALAFDNFNDRSATGPAVTSAISAATANQVMSGNVTVQPQDVEFLDDEFGDPTRVKVTVYRRASTEPGRNNPIQTLIARYFGMATADVAATATAEASPANAMTCVKPFTIPDKWQENTEEPWDSSDTFDAFDNRGDPIPGGDVYIPATNPDGSSNPNYTGYNNERERGERLMLRADNGSKITVSFYFSIAIAGITGGSEYDWNIANCNTHIMERDDLLLHEPGAMVGPTVSGIEALIAKDPNATWDIANKRVTGSQFPGQSPRVFPIPLYDPVFYESGKRNGREADLMVANWIGFFAEEVVGSQIYGRIIPIAGIRTGNNAPDGLFPRAIRLVK